MLSRMTKIKWQIEGRTTEVTEEECAPLKRLIRHLSLSKTMMARLCMGSMHLKLRGHW